MRTLGRSERGGNIVRRPGTISRGNRPLLPITTEEMEEEVGARGTISTGGRTRSDHAGGKTRAREIHLKEKLVKPMQKTTRGLTYQPPEERRAGAP